MLTIIAAVAKNSVIGHKNTIPWSIPAEMELFRSITLNHPVIMGRKTFESIGYALPNRENIILSRRGNGILMNQALERVRGKDAFVIGGESIYAQMMPFADELLISHLHEAFDGDARFPIIDQTIWKNVAQTTFPDFTHKRYIRI